MAGQALKGIKVLDLSNYIAGSYCSRILAGFGAEVIKVENPCGGDPTRHIGPFLHDNPDREKSGLFLYLNVNKKSITLNLESNIGAKIFKRIAKDTDVVIESFNPGVMEHLGLGYESLETLNPRLVLTSVTNFGQTGPYRDYKSAHLIAWGMSGARYTDGRPGNRPVQAGGSVTYYIAGVHALVGTMTALCQRNNSGTGQHVDTSLMESMILSTVYPSVAYSYLGEMHTPLALGSIGIFPCKDGYIGLNVFQKYHWDSMCAFFGMPELIDDPRFQTIKDIRDRYDEARAIFGPKVMEREKQELFEAGIGWRIPFGLVPTTEELLQSPQHNERNFFEEVEHPVVGKVKMPGAPFKLMETPWQLTSPAPLLGQHNEEVFCQRLGFTKDDLVVLKQQGVI